jgi:hypothetical protein
LRRFGRQFFSSLGIVFPALVVMLVIWTRATSADLSAKPSYPVPGRSFVAEYGGVGAYAAHMIYYWGLFGMADTIRHADLLLLGSSHTQFGLSARQLSETLSAQAGRPITAFNLGMGCGESALFGAETLERLVVRGKAVVADLYNTNSQSPCGAAAVHADPVEAYFKVLAIWAKFTWDWLLDGSLPAIIAHDGSATISRFLTGSIVILDWDYGDATYCSRPSEGTVFPTAERNTAYPVQGFRAAVPDNSPAKVTAEAKLLGEFAAQRLEPVLTLIPSSDDEESLPTTTAPRSGAQALFIGLSGQGLATFDHHHLTGASREIATGRLLEGMRKKGLLPAVSTGPPPRLAPPFSRSS